MIIAYIIKRKGEEKIFLADWITTPYDIKDEELLEEMPKIFPILRGIESIRRAKQTRSYLSSTEQIDEGEVNFRVDIK